MKNTKKKVLVVALIVGLVAILSIGSLAWFTAKDEVTNTFKFATDEHGQVDFSIDLYEHKPDPNDQTKIDSGDLGLKDGATYMKVLPGIAYFKDPTVKNTGDYDQWVRVKVTVNHANAWKAACTKYSITDLSSIFGGYVEADWTRGEIISDTNGDTLTYEYYLNSKLVPDATKTMFTSVTIPKEFTQEDVVGMENFTVTVKAEAIQADGTGNTPQAAFALLETN